MKPGHIKVFNGLRVTTEHMNHLQDSFHSALQDFREILGVGKIQTGYEVEKEGHQAIKVLPGLAFDFQKNRIVCDQPQTLNVTFEAGEETKYVCIEYAQVEDCVVEGQPTLIWDSCKILLNNTFPTPEDNLVTIAVLERNQEQDTFELVTLQGQDETQGLEESTGTTDAEEQDAATTAVVEPGVADEESPMPSDDETEDGIAGNEMVEAAPTEALPMDEEYERETESDPEIPIPKPQAWRWPVEQGVVRMGGDDEEMSVNALLMEPLSRKLGASGNNVCGSDLHFKLAEEPVALDFYPVSLNCQTIIQADLWIAGDPGDGETPSVQQRVQSTSQGEVTFVEETISQFGVTSIHPQPGAILAGLPEWTIEVNETGIGNLYFSDRSASDAIPEDVINILRGLYLLVKVEIASDRGFKVTVKLVWNGGVDEPTIQAIELWQIRFTWESVIAWKAFGGSSVNSSRMEVIEK